MRLDIYHHITFESGQLARVEAAVNQLLQRSTQIMATLDDLVTKVNDQSGTIDSMATFIQGLEQQVKDALAGVTLPPDAQAKVDAVFSTLGANTTRIANAIDNDPNT